MTMSEPQVEQLHENTQHISDIRNAFDSFRDNEFKKFKENILFIVSIIGVFLSIGALIWYLAMFVFKTNNDGANNHNDMIELRKHIDAKFKEQGDSINNISHRQLINQVDMININRQLHQHAEALKSLNQKCDRLYGIGFMTEHKDCPTCKPTMKTAQ